MEFSRRQKNTILWAVNGLFFALALARALLDASSTRGLLWMIGAVVVVFLHQIPERLIAKTIRHAALFLLTGTAMGWTLGRAVRQPSELWLLEWLWLGVAIVGVFIHYSPIPRDPYA